MIKNYDQREEVVKVDKESGDMVNGRMDDHEVKVKVNSGVVVIVGETRKVDTKVSQGSVGMNEVSGGMVDQSGHLQQDTSKINKSVVNNTHDSNLLLCKNQNLHVVVDGSCRLVINTETTDASSSVVSRGENLRRGDLVKCWWIRMSTLDKVWI